MKISSTYVDFYRNTRTEIAQIEMSNFEVLVFFANFNIFFKIFYLVEDFQKSEKIIFWITCQIKRIIQMLNFFICVCSRVSHISFDWIDPSKVITWVKGFGPTVNLVIQETKFRENY